MEVIAIKPAFYDGNRVRVGDKLEVPSTLKGSWFVPESSPQAKTPKESSPPAKGPKTLSEMARQPAGASFNEVHQPK